MVYNVPGFDEFQIETIILDLNGTISVDGVIIKGVKERLKILKQLGFRIILFTGNTRGDADKLCAEIGIEWKQAKNGDDKKVETENLNAKKCASIGNGNIDIEMFKVVRLAVTTLQSEGISRDAILHSHIVVPTINDALDLFINKDRLIATLRK